MKILNMQDQFNVSAGCGECKAATIEMIRSCTMDQMNMIKQVFKHVVMHPDMANADGETLKAAFAIGIEQLDME